MKKLLVIMFMFALSASMFAQRASSTTTLLTSTGQPISLKNLTTTSADTITQGATAYWSFDVGNRPKSYYYTFAIGIDTVTSSTNRLAVTVWGSMDNVNWVSSGITQVNVFPTAGGGADTTLQMSSVTTASLWRYLKVRFVSVDANVKGARLKSLGLKLGEK